MLPHNMAAPKTQKHSSWPKDILLLLHVTSLTAWAIFVYITTLPPSQGTGFGFIALIPILYLIFIPFIWNVVLLERYLAQKLGNTTIVKITLPILLIAGYIISYILLGTSSTGNSGKAGTSYLVFLPMLATVIIGLALIVYSYIKNNEWLKLLLSVLIAALINFSPIIALVRLFLN